MDSRAIGVCSGRAGDRFWLCFAGFLCGASMLVGGLGCSDPVENEASESTSPRRVLLIIADDLGVDAMGLWADTDGDGKPDDGRTYPTMPTLSAVCRDGVRFTHAWSAPTCSPTRASILTGRYGLRTGVGWAVGKKNELQLTEHTLPEALTARGVANANIGKWHLGTSTAIGGDDAPRKAGWQHFSGELEGALADYRSWPRTVDGVTTATSTYATTANVDDAIGWLQKRTAAEPWLLWLAFNAPRSPFHKPPDALHDDTQLSGATAHVKNHPELYYRATVQAMDTEIGRLLTAIQAQGQGPIDIVFIGDNGTPGQVTETPFVAEHAKGSLYQGGVHVPLCIGGPSVREGGRTSAALVHTVDLYATILGLFGVTVGDLPAGAGQDSANLGPLLADTSAAPARTWNYTEAFGDPSDADKTTGRTVRDARFKLISWANGARGLFDLDADPLETKNLLDAPLATDASAAQTALSARMDAL